ncbi:DNA helicase IV [Klebsiella pneumoniae]|uniref:DNA helicase IV n=1 Tax=Klebsiella pneumoniae TaxID=573 RepID=A0A378F6I2_KLEPN|nr:DNA helicase IV [Klebsiella pneumoniae]
MSDIAAGVLKQQLATIEHTRAEGKWLTRQQVADVQDNIRHALTSLPMPTGRLDAFDNCRELWRECQRWLAILKRRVWPITRPLPSDAGAISRIFDSVESSPLNASQARAVVNGERSLRCWRERAAVKTSVLVGERAWLLARGEAAADKFAAGIRPPGGAGNG